MASADAPAPTAEGDLTRTPFAHVLLYAHQHQLTGTLVVWPEQDGSGEQGQDRIRFDAGRPVAGRLRSSSSRLDMGMLPLFNRTNAPYAFYEADLVGAGDGVVEGAVDAYALVTASLRGSARQDMIDRVLGGFGSNRLRLRRGFDLKRFEFDARERGFIELLRAEPASVGVLIESYGDPRLVRRLLYLLAIVQAVETWDGEDTGRHSTGGAGGEPARPNVAPAPVAPPAAAPPSPAPPAAAPASAPTRPRSVRPPHLAPDVPPDPPADLTPELAARWKQISLRAQSIEEKNYFEMLSVTFDANPQDVQAAYFELVKVWHPDRLEPELIELKPWMDRIFHHLTQAQDTLADMAKKTQYLQSVQAGGGTPESDRQVNAIVTAAMAFQKVEVFMKKRDYTGAMEILKEAIELAPDEADYYATEGWLMFLSADGKKKPYRQIHEHLDRALELNKRSERANMYKAKTLKQQGKSAEALKFFQIVVDINRKNTDAMREVRLATMRSQKEKDGGGMLGRLFGGGGKKK